jgi:alkanesulfonate monooxygenase SsuD/methylene tetrahydromethanopterin reductase-like flavin-dependent oxidoreductase (luciferase family)
MTEHNRVSFGIKTSQMGLTYDEILAIWRDADQIPAIEHAWLWDHMLPMRGDPRAAALEAWTLLAALAAQTTRLRLGVMVTSNRLRRPSVLAKMAATVDIIAGGRLVFGIGAGGALAPAGGLPPGENPAIREFEAHGIPLVPARDAIADLAEACVIFRRMWTETEPFDFGGRSYQLKGAVCEPKPVQAPHPPLMIGAGGEKLALRVVAEHANIWNYPTQTVDEYRRKSEVLDDHCAAIGRDPDEIVRSVQLLVRCGDPAEPRATRQRIRELTDAGATHIVLAPIGSPGPPAQWLAQQIIAPIRGHAPL